MDNLLKLIEKGDLDGILSDDKLLPKLNELIKYELVVIKGEAVLLSEKGQEAKIIGVEKVLQKAKYEASRSVQKDIITFEQRKKNVWLIGLLILVVIMLLILLSLLN